MKKSTTQLKTEAAQSDEFQQFKRLAAAAMQNTRDALYWINEIDPIFFVTVEAELEILQEKVENRDILSEAFREAATTVLHHMSRFDEADHPLRDLFSGPCNSLHMALCKSNKISDLIAAEKALERILKRNR